MISTWARHMNIRWAKAIWLVWSWLVPFVVLVVIALKLTNDPENLHLLTALKIPNWQGLVLCLLLLPLNVGFESFKWQYILKPIEHKSLSNCAKIVLSGKSLNVISPFGAGDAFSRFLGLSMAHRKQIYAALAIDRFSQLLPTLIFGTMAVIFLVSKGVAVPTGRIALALSISSALILIGVIGINLFQKKLKSYLLLFHMLGMASVLNILGLSIGRYMIFAIQFYCIFWWLGCELSATTIAFGIAWIFLIKTLLPNMSVLGDLAKREVSAALFFSFFMTDLNLVLVASFVVWGINIVLPALAGLYFVSDLKKSF